MFQPVNWNLRLSLSYTHTHRHTHPTITNPALFGPIIGESCRERSKSLVPTPGLARQWGRRALMPHAAVNHMAQCLSCQGLSNYSASTSEGFSYFFLNFISFCRLCNHIDSSWHSLDEEIWGSKKGSHSPRVLQWVSEERLNERSGPSLTPFLFPLLILKWKNRKRHPPMTKAF